MDVKHEPRGHGNLRQDCEQSRKLVASDPRKERMHVGGMGRHSVALIAGLPESIRKFRRLVDLL
ncbi:hypothetical protein BD309DRAFT_972000 [Dichomitus squalens]|uniref:Uncharacterized protein n=1 Tax=Dichomitus squalens TaxID=114155 RepID=A0A4Q9NG15_9APHY|nr:hypothetical protein BD309DRAFT_972000 [Dichomitus squalens]TBU63203.1 hypothetical protein BD310DRAFT_916972 [Dichomitus squalens]